MISDVFALGTVLAFAATGHDPFRGPTVPSVITRILTGPPDLDPLAGDLRRIIGDCLAKAPGDRPSPGDLLGRFGHPAPTVSPGAPAPAGGGRPPGTAPGLSLAGTVGMAPAQWTGPEPAGRKLPRRTGLIAGGAAAVVGLAIAGSIWLANRPPPGPPTVLTDPGSGTVQSIAFGPGGILAVGGSGGTTYLWNTTTGQITATLYAPATRGFDSVAFGPGSIVAGGGGGGHGQRQHLPAASQAGLTSLTGRPRLFSATSRRGPVSRHVVRSQATARLAGGYRAAFAVEAVGLPLAVRAQIVYFGSLSGDEPDVISARWRLIREFRDRSGHRVHVAFHSSESRFLFPLDRSRYGCYTRKDPEWRRQDVFDPP
jgi:hypothetical protein